MLDRAMATGGARLPAARARAGTLQVRPASAAEHAGWLAERSPGSFLQLPGWAAVEPDWEGEHLAWTTPDGEIVGTGLVLHRRIPMLGRSLAYLPEGPVIDWGSADLATWLAPLVAHLRSRRAFAVRIGPPVLRRWWSTTTVLSALGAGRARFLSDVPPDGVGEQGNRVAAQLHALGWVPAPGTVDVPEPGDEYAVTVAGPQGRGLGAGQPQYVLQVPLEGRSLQEVHARFSPQWRRSLRVAEWHGVHVDVGGLDDLPAFHHLYRLTALREGFVPRPLAYFQRMLQALADPGVAGDGWGVSGSGTGTRLYVARQGGQVRAAAVAVRVGDHVWHAYGASSNDDRHVKARNALQWRIVRDAHASGAAVYDLRDVGPSLDREDPLFRLTRFKLGAGGRVVEQVGEWDLPLNGPLYRAVGGYLRRRRAAGAAAGTAERVR